MDVETAGLSIDMLDADRLREWARLLLVHGPDISHWGSVPHVAGKMQIMATGIEKAVRDIGELRKADRLKADLATLRAEHERLTAQYTDLQSVARYEKGRADDLEGTLAACRKDLEAAREALTAERVLVSRLTDFLRSLAAACGLPNDRSREEMYQALDQHISAQREALLTAQAGAKRIRDLRDEMVRQATEGLRIAYFPRQIADKLDRIV